MAAQSLLSGECDMALAGGVSIELPHRQGYRYARGRDPLARRPLPRLRRRRPGHPLRQRRRRRRAAASRGRASRDRDNIYAVIRGSAVNNDGSQQGRLPRTQRGRPGRARPPRRWRVAGVEPGSVTYIEAHGTGTPVGDPIEIAALTQAYRRGRSRLLRHRLDQDQHRPPGYGGGRRIASSRWRSRCATGSSRQPELQPAQQPHRLGEHALPRRRQRQRPGRAAARRAAPPSTRSASAAPTPT